MEARAQAGRAVCAQSSPWANRQQTSPGLPHRAKQGLASFLSTLERKLSLL